MPKYKTGDKTMTLRKYDTIHNTITDLFDSKSKAALDAPPK